jgi:hypothetical protein
MRRRTLGSRAGVGGRQARRVRRARWHGYAACGHPAWPIPIPIITPSPAAAAEAAGEGETRGPPRHGPPPPAAAAAAVMGGTASGAITATETGTGAAPACGAARLDPARAAAAAAAAEISYRQRSSVSGTTGRLTVGRCTGRSGAETETAGAEEGASAERATGGKDPEGEGRVGGGGYCRTRSSSATL